MLGNLLSAIYEPLGAVGSAAVLAFLLTGFAAGISVLIGAIRSGDANLKRRFSNGFWAFYAPEAADLISGLRR